MKKEIYEKTYTLGWRFWYTFGVITGIVGTSAVWFVYWVST